MNLNVRTNRIEKAYNSGEVAFSADCNESFTLRSAVGEHVRVELLLLRD